MNRRYDILRTRIRPPAKRTGLLLAVERMQRLVARLFGRYAPVASAYPGFDLIYRFVSGNMQPEAVTIRTTVVHTPPPSRAVAPASSARIEPLHHRVSHRHLHTIRFTGAAEGMREALVGQPSSPAAPAVEPGRIETLIHREVEREAAVRQNVAPSVARETSPLPAAEERRHLRVRDIIRRERETREENKTVPRPSPSAPETTQDTQETLPLEYRREQNVEQVRLKTVTNILRRSLSTTSEETVLRRSRMRLSVREWNAPAVDPVVLTDAGGMGVRAARSGASTEHARENGGDLETPGVANIRLPRAPLVHRRPEPAPAPEAPDADVVTPEVLQPERRHSRESSSAHVSTPSQAPVYKPDPEEIQSAVHSALQDLSSSSVSGLAERVFEQLDKKMARERDRRGLL